MKISSVGGVIAAANQELSFPMEKIGSLTAIKRIALLFRQAGVFPIVVTTSEEAYEVRYKLTASGVVFLPIEKNNKPELFESAKAGLLFLENKCKKIVFIPVNIPFFSIETLTRLIQANGEIVVPSYEKRAGHPIVIDTTLVKSILAYKGDRGLRGALAPHEEKRRWLEVKDQGILMRIQNQETEYTLGESKFRAFANLCLEKECSFFDARAKLLLLLIAHKKSVRGACDLMALSYSKAWEIINQLEGNVGFCVIERKHGGKSGGRSDLTQKGYVFLEAYQTMEEQLIKNTNSAFADFMKKLN